jgi:hypothetical protein
MLCSYRNFQDQLVTTIVGLEGIENGRQLLLIVEFDWECIISCEFQFSSFSGASKSSLVASTTQRSNCHTVNNSSNDLMNLAML